MNKILVLVIGVLICSCGNEKKPTPELTNVGQSKINYPFKYIDTRKEMWKDGSNYNEMLLFTCGNKPSLDTLQLFCSSKKKDFRDGVFHIVVFFDKKENAKFTTNPVTALYIDEKPSKHIKAIYTYNKVNGYSKLDYYEKNSWESPAITSEIN